MNLHKILKNIAKTCHSCHFDFYDESLEILEVEESVHYRLFESFPTITVFASSTCCECGEKVYKMIEIDKRSKEYKRVMQLNK